MTTFQETQEAEKRKNQEDLDQKRKARLDIIVKKQKIEEEKAIERLEVKKKQLNSRKNWEKEAEKRT